MHDDGMSAQRRRAGATFESLDERSDALEHRPQLKAALAAARKLKCQVAVAKLDRLSRDVHFISVAPSRRRNSALNRSISSRPPKRKRSSVTSDSAYQ
jgi:DNA invertase Pin-like site-specific DNA recombinase